MRHLRLLAPGLLTPALLGVLALLAAVAWQALPAAAATITVNTTADGGFHDATCSLRAAIQAANTDAAVGGCAAGSGADIIVLPAGTYTLDLGGSGEDANQTGDLDIVDDVTINGAGAAATIVRQVRSDRVIDINPPVAVVTISGLTIANGSVGGSLDGGSGGGIRNDGTLTLTNVAVSGNRSCGTCQGGGIRNIGTLTVTNSTVNGNTAGSNGGGIENNAGTLTVTNSTISGNSAGGNGGGIDNKDTASVANSTISGNADNQSGGGGDGGAIRNGSGAATSLKNTIVANSLPSGTNCAGTITSLGHNLSSDASCAASFTASGDLNNTNPMLGALGNNGGPTQTQALLAGSPAIDAGSPDCPPPASDQRGVSRPRDGDGNGSAVCDIGAYEFGDADADGVLDAADNCPNAGNPGQENTDAALNAGGAMMFNAALPADALGDACDSDDDNDQFSDVIEIAIGTNPLDNCPKATGPGTNGDSWPLDNVVSSTATVADILSYKGKTPHAVDGTHPKRLDLDNDNQLTVADILKYKGKTPSSCT